MTVICLTVSALLNGGVGDCVQAGMSADLGAGGSCVGVQNAGV